MDLAPLTDYKEPDYPTQEALCAQPEALRKLPRRWKERGGVVVRWAGILAGTAFFLSLLSTGTYGCVAVNPPVYLTEDEARNIIETEARQSGFDFSERGHVIHGVDLPVTRHGFSFSARSQERKEPPKKPHKEGETELDGWDAKHHVGYKFVIERDAREWREKYGRTNPPVRIFDRFPMGPDYEPGKDMMIIFTDRFGGHLPDQRSKEAAAQRAKNGPTPPPGVQESMETHAERRNMNDLRNQVREFLRLTDYGYDL